MGMLSLQLDEVVRREIDHQHHAARLHHARGLREGRSRIVGVVQHMMDGDDVEALGLEGQGVHVALANLGIVDAGAGEVGPGQCQHLAALIHTHGTLDLRRQNLEQAAGAGAVLMVNSSEGLPPYEGQISGVTIPFLGVSSTDATALLALDGLTVALTATAPDPTPIEHERPVLAAVLASCAALIMALGLYAFSHASGDVPLGWALLPARLIGAVAVFLPLLITRKLQITKLTFLFVVIMTLTEAVGYTLFSTAAADSAAIASVMSSMYRYITTLVIFMRLILKELLCQMLFLLFYFIQMFLLVYNIFHILF